MAANGAGTEAPEKKPGFQIGPWGCALMGAGLFVLALSIVAGLAAIHFWLNDDRSQAEISADATAVIESGPLPANGMTLMLPGRRFGEIMVIIREPSTI